MGEPEEVRALKTELRAYICGVTLSNISGSRATHLPASGDALDCSLARFLRLSHHCMSNRYQRIVRTCIQLSTLYERNTLHPH